MNNTILIDKRQNRQRQESCLIHEIIEVLNYDYGWKFDHAIISQLETGIYQKGNFVQVSAVNGRAFTSNTDAGFYSRVVGVPRKYSPREKLVDVVNMALEQCDEAIRRNCGFGKYTNNQV